MVGFLLANYLRLLRNREKAERENNARERKVIEYPESPLATVNFVLTIKGSVWQVML
jgi:hypothetical protein